MFSIFKRATKTIVLAGVGLALALLAGEGVIRLGTADQKTYVIEMWRYAKLLKQPSDDPSIGHEHRPGQTAILQNVEVSLNSLGMRGPELLPRDPQRKRVAIIGDSMALGWGVPEEETLRSVLSRRLGPDYEVFSTGVGNMNARQVVANWARYSATVEADTVLLFTTVRSTEPQSTAEPGWLLRNSQMVALAATFAGQIGSGATDREGLIDRYRDMWTGPEGQAIMDDAFTKLAQLQKEHGFKVVVAQAPETNDFQAYDFGFLSAVTAEKAARQGWPFIDLFPPFRGLPASDFWAAKGDFHLNGAAIEMIAEEILPHVR